MAKSKSFGFVGENLTERLLPEGKNYLLVIAIDQYEHLPRLYNCKKDAEDLIRILTERYYFEPAEIVTIFDREANKNAIYRSFRDMAQRVTVQDNLLIYFSGHGEYDPVFKQGYWIPVDAQKGEYYQYIPNSEIRTFLSAIDSHHTFLMVDSCFSGSLFAAGTGKNVSRRYERDPSRWGLTSGRNEIVSDGKPGDNSPFAESLLYRLGTSTKSMGVQELCAYVLEYVEANSSQTPIGEPLLIGGHKNGQFVFHPRASKEELLWQKACQSDDILGYDNYLQAFPQGEYVKEAEKRLRKAEDKAAWEAALRLDSISAYRNYLRKYEKGNYLQQAEERIIYLRSGITEKMQKVETSPETSPAGTRPADVGVFTDPRDGQRYQTVKLKDNKIWLAQNLNFQIADGSFFYNDSPKNGEIFGRLYQWEKARLACPPGWHLPSDEEWKALLKLYGGYYDFLEDKDHGLPDQSFKALIEGGPGGFSAQLGGYRDSEGLFYGLGESGNYWTCSPFDDNDAMAYYFYRDSLQVARGGDMKDWAFSCRCIRD